MSPLILTLIQLGFTYGPALVKDIADLIHSNPILPDETEDAYVARINPLITAKLDDAAQNDAAVETTDNPTPPAQ